MDRERLRKKLRAAIDNPGDWEVARAMLAEMEALDELADAAALAAGDGIIRDKDSDVPMYMVEHRFISRLRMVLSKIDSLRGGHDADR